MISLTLWFYNVFNALEPLKCNVYPSRDGLLNGSLSCECDAFMLWWLPPETVASNLFIVKLWSMFFCVVEIIMRASSSDRGTNLSVGIAAFCKFNTQLLSSINFSLFIRNASFNQWIFQHSRHFVGGQFIASQRQHWNWLITYVTLMFPSFFVLRITFSYQQMIFQTSIQFSDISHLTLIEQKKRIRIWLQILQPQSQGRNSIWNRLS